MSALSRRDIVFRAGATAAFPFTLSLDSALLPAQASVARVEGSAKQPVYNKALVQYVVDGISRVHARHLSGQLTTADSLSASEQLRLLSRHLEEIGFDEGIKQLAMNPSGFITGGAVKLPDYGYQHVKQFLPSLTPDQFGDFGDTIFNEEQVTRGLNRIASQGISWFFREAADRHVNDTLSPEPTLTGGEKVSYLNDSEEGQPKLLKVCLIKQKLSPEDCADLADFLAALAALGLAVACILGTVGTSWTVVVAIVIGILCALGAFFIAIATIEIKKQCRAVHG